MTDCVGLPLPLSSISLVGPTAVVSLGRRSYSVT